MAPKSPWKTKNGNNQKPQNDALKSPDKEIKSQTAVTNYEQTQNEELEVLQAIYMEDFKEIETKSAWSKHSDKAFRLRLKAMSDDGVHIILLVKFTATYPKTLPSITVQQVGGLRPKTQKTIESIVKVRPKELLGDVMIHEIASTIGDVLEDEAQFKANGEMLPSLEEERVVQEAALSKLAQQQEEEEAKRRQKEKAEEDRILQQVVEEEMTKRRDLKRKSRVVAAEVPSWSEYFLLLIRCHSRFANSCPPRIKWVEYITLNSRSISS
jgi:translation initiation factor 2-alpha kinase 4